MEIQATQKYLHSTPRKLRLVADLVRPMTPALALQTLRFTKKAAAADLIKAIKTALANARQKNVDTGLLVFKSLEVNEGPKMKRFRAGTRGRVKRYVKETSHVKIVLTERVESKEEAK